MLGAGRGRSYTGVGEVVAGQGTLGRLDDRDTEAQALEPVALKGKRHPVEAFRVRAPASA